MTLLLLLARVALAEEPKDFNSFVASTEASGSTSVIIMQNGTTLVEWHRRGQEHPAQLASCTKSISSLAIGRLLDEGRIRSLEDPLSTWFPESGERLGAITLRQVLSATSGLRTCQSDRCGRAWRRDLVGFALESDLVQSPGRWAYSNNAPNLLSGVVEKVTGQTLAAYTDEFLFTPLGIESAVWGSDPAGATPAYAGLSMTASDLIRIGQMMLAGGNWNGSRVMSEETVQVLTTPQAEHPWYALLWWPVYRDTWGISEATLEYWTSLGVDPESIRDLKPIAGEQYRTQDECVAAEVAALGGEDAGHRRWGALVWTSGMACEKRAHLVGYSAEGSLGQFLVVLPEVGVVAVRQRRVGHVYVAPTEDPDSLDTWPSDLAAYFVASGG